MEDLYFTEHFPVAVSQVCKCQRIFYCGNFPLGGNLVYTLFISSNWLGILDLYFDTLIKGSVEIVRVC